MPDRDGNGPRKDSFMGNIGRKGKGRGFGRGGCVPKEQITYPSESEIKNYNKK